MICGFSNNVATELRLRIVWKKCFGNHGFSFIFLCRLNFYYNLSHKVPWSGAITSLYWARIVPITICSFLVVFLSSHAHQEVESFLERIIPTQDGSMHLHIWNRTWWPPSKVVSRSSHVHQEVESFLERIIQSQDCSMQLHIWDRTWWPPSKVVSRSSHVHQEVESLHRRLSVMNDLPAQLDVILSLPNAQ